MTDPRIVSLLQEEANRRAQAKTKHVDLISTAFDKQAAFIRDPSKRKAALCSRRSGKSYAVAIYLIQEALRVPRSTVLYLALTKDSARRTMVKDVLEPILTSHKIIHTYNKTTREYTFTNGSKLYLSGADASPKETEKTLGQKNLLVVVDECASFSQDLNEIVQKIAYSLRDYHGTMVLIGTPSDYINNLFYDITRDDPDPKIAAGWSVHRWNWRDNPFTLKEQTAAHDEEVAANPKIIDTDLYKQHSLGLWAINESALVYRCTEQNEIPPFNSDGYHFVLGLDLGYEDDSAFVIAGFIRSDPALYIIESHKQKHLDITAVANYVKTLRSRFQIHRFIVDGANKQGVEEMRARHLIPFEAAEKAGKFDFIHLMNADFRSDRLKIVAPTNQELLKEYKQLVWDAKDPTKERASCENHLCDAALYAWRACKHYRPITPATPNSDPNDPPPRLGGQYKALDFDADFFTDDNNTDWIDKL